MAVLGVDGWRGPWVGALLDGRDVTLLALPDVVAVLAVPDVELVAIDMPIGLSDDGVRACDVARPAAAGPAGSSVFPAPVRAVLGCADYAEALRGLPGRTAPPRAPSVQAFQLVPAIRALDDALGEPPIDRTSSRCIRSSRSAPSPPDVDATGRARPAELAQRIRALAAGDGRAGRTGRPHPSAFRRSTRSTPAPRRGPPGGWPTASAECVGDGAHRQPRPSDADLLVTVAVSVNLRPEGGLRDSRGRGGGRRDDRR